MNNFAILLKKFLRILILILLVFIIVVKYKKHSIVSYESEFYKNFESAMKNGTFYAYGDYTLDDIFNGKITVVNMYNMDDIHNLYNVSLSNKIKETFGNDVNVIDIIIKDGGDFISEEILNLSSNEEENFIEKYNIKRPVFSLTESDMKQYFNINNPINKILILNEKGELEHIKTNGTDYNSILKDIIDISKSAKMIYEKKLENTETVILEDKNFMQSFSKFIIIENFENMEIPAFALLDENKIVIAKFNGEIIYVIDSEKFCQITNMKYIGGKLYLTDACNSAIYEVNFDAKQIETLVTNSNLFGISDFDFINDEELLVAKGFDYGIGIFDIKSGTFENLSVRLNLDYKIGKVNRISKILNRFYYFDVDMNILYSYGNNKNVVELDLNSFDDLTIYSKITNFYINSRNNVYFMDAANNRIIRSNHKKIEEIDMEKLTDQKPLDLVVYGNIYYLLTKENIQQINWYAGKKDIINLYFSNNTKNFFNTTDIPTDYNEYALSENKLGINSIMGDMNIAPYSPSFILMFEKVENEIFPVKVFYYDSFLNNEEIVMDKDYVLFGNIFYNENDKIKIKDVNIILKRKPI